LVAFMLIGLSLAGLILVGCTPKFTTPTLVAAKGGDVSKLNPIAVVNFSGNGGSDLGNDVEAMLVSTQVQGRPYFTVVDRQAIDKVLQEIGFGQSGVVDEKTTVRIGKLVGAKGIVLGAVGNNTAVDTSYTEKRSECIDKKCQNKRTYTVRCGKRDAHFSFTPKIIDVATGRIVLSGSVAGSKNDRSCQDGNPITDKTAMLSDAKHLALGQLRQLVAPYTVNVSLRPTNR
jgi:curli biogenesis system outer membrane secretion channel CsgG